MDFKQLVIVALQVSILSTVFGFGLKTTSEDMLYLVRRPGLLVRSLIAVFLIVPVVAVVLDMMFDFRPTLEVVLVALSLSPVPPLLPTKESKAGGERSYALGLMALLALLSIVVIPLSVEVLAFVFGRSFRMAPGAIARVALITVILPLVAGITVRAWLPAVADRLEKVVSLITKTLLPLAALVLIVGSWRGMWAAVGDGTIVAIIIFVAAGLLAGHLLGGPDPEHAVVLALSSACRHPAIALTIAVANFPARHFEGTILLYLVISALIGVPYLAWHRRQTATAMAPA
jgi:BASS family bile acid:Na+ symporter